MGFIEVEKKLFNLFMGWYHHNVCEVRSEVITVADRVNFYDGELLIGYIYVYGRESYYIEKDKYGILTIDK